MNSRYLFIVLTSISQFYVKYLISSVFTAINSSQTNSVVHDRSEQLLHAYIYKWACKVDEKECIVKVKKDFNKWKKKANPDDENP